MKVSTLACLCFGAWISLMWTNAQQADKIKELTAKVQALESINKEKM